MLGALPLTAKHKIFTGFFPSNKLKFGISSMFHLGNNPGQNSQSAQMDPVKICLKKSSLMALLI